MVTELITPESLEVVEQARRTGSTPESVATVMRITAATQEARALKEWQRTGVGEAPAIPNLTAIREGATIMKASKSTKSSVARTERRCDYTRNGELSKQKRAFVLSNVAYQCTAGIGSADVKRISTKELIALLATLGVDDPMSPGWEVELPNGVKVGAVPIDSIPVVETVTRKTTAKASTGKTLVPSPKARVARKSAATRAKTTARKAKGADPKVTRGASKLATA